MSGLCPGRQERTFICNMCCARRSIQPYAAANSSAGSSFLAADAKMSKSYHVLSLLGKGTLPTHR